MRTLLCLLLTCAMTTLAADKPQKAFPFAYDQHDFPNGLRLITIPTDYPNVVALYIVVQTGSRNEVEEGRSGFAHLFEHVMFRGTKKVSPAQYEAVLKQAGAASNAYTSDDLTAYHTTFSKEDTETILRLEADRFLNLSYSPDVFKTETLAVLGEYNKNSADPTSKLFEVLRDTAFDKHTYKHTTMGFLRDVQAMPTMYDYSQQFFGRYYRPEYTTIILAGDVTPAAARALVTKHWGNWSRGSYKPEVPVEAPQKEPRQGHIDWPTPTLPWLTVGFRGPAYTDTTKENAALDLLSYLGFSESSPLYQQLVIEEQKVDAFFADNSDHVDPYLFSISARVKKQEDMANVQERILKTVREFQTTPVAADKLEAVKRHLRYQFALSLDNSEAIASTVARYVALRRTPETINRVYDLYAQVTPADIQSAAKQYLKDESRTIVTLTGAKQK